MQPRDSLFPDPEIRQGSQSRMKPLQSLGTRKVPEHFIAEGALGVERGTPEACGNEDLAKLGEPAEGLVILRLGDRTVHVDTDNVHRAIRDFERIIDIVPLTLEE